MVRLSGPAPGTPLGPMKLPVSYSKMQMIQYGFVKGRWNHTTYRWEVIADPSDWKEPPVVLDRSMYEIPR